MKVDEEKRNRYLVEKKLINVWERAEDILDVK
jgi:hypothetical protein